MNTPDLTLVGNLSEFSRKSGIPLRTLQRVKRGFAVSVVTQIALDQAYRKHGPKEPKKEQA